MLTNLINSLKLNSASKAELDKLLELPEVHAILDREEKNKIDRRKELIAQLSKLPSRYKKQIEEAGKKAADSRQLLQRLEKELLVARCSNSVDEMQALFANQQMTTEQREITNELVNGRDLRIDDLYTELSRLLDQVRNLVSVVVMSSKNVFGGIKTRYSDNTDKVCAAITAIKECMNQLEELVYSPVSRLDVTEAMSGMCAGLEDVLSSLDLTPPIVDEHGEVKPPAILSGKSSAIPRLNS